MAHVSQLPAELPYVLRPAAAQALLLGVHGPYARDVLYELRQQRFEQLLGVREAQLFGPDELGLYSVAGHSDSPADMLVWALARQLVHVLGPVLAHLPLHAAHAIDQARAFETLCN